MGRLYLLHFETPYRHARHYLGYTSRDVETRVAYHLRGQGSPLVRAVVEAGIDVTVARTWDAGSRSFERQLKGHSSTRLCPLCRGPRALARGKRAPVTP